MKAIQLLICCCVFGAVRPLVAATVYQEDFSAAPSLVFSSGGNDDIAYGAAGAMDQAYGPVAYAAAGEWAVSPSGTDPVWDNAAGELDIYPNNAGRRDGYGVFINTSTMTAGTYTVSFDVTGFSASTGSNIYWGLFEGSGAGTGHVLAQIRRNSGSDLLTFSTGNGASVSQVGTTQSFSATQTVSADFNVSAAGHTGDFIALFFTKKDNENVGFSLDNVQITFQPPPPLTGLESFDTGYTILQVRTAQSNGTYLVGSSYEGTVLGMSTNGTLLWTNALSGFMNHDVACADLTGDGVDEILAANADGSIYCLDSSGALQWQYRTNSAIMNAVAVIHDAAGTPFVVCGGFDQTIRYLDAAGQLVKTVPSSAYSVDKPWGENAPPDYIHNANFLRVHTYADGSEDLLVHSTVGWSSRGHFYWFKPLAGLPYKTVNIDKAYAPSNYGFMSDYDVNGDGTNEYFCGTSGHRNEAMMTIYDPAANAFSAFSIADAFRLNPAFSDTHYKVTEPVVVSPDGTNLVYFILHGHHILLTDSALNTNTVEFVKSGYSFYDIAKFPDDPARVILSSVQSGGSCIHVLNTADPSWKAAYANLQPPGKIAAILTHTDNLWTNLASFSKPVWEHPQPVRLMTGDNLDSQQAHFDSITNSYTSPVMLNWLGAFNKETTNWRTNANGFTNDEYRTRLKNGIGGYTLAQQQAIDQFTPHYAGVPGIAAWFGHGNDPNWYQPSTIQAITDIAAGQGKELVMLWPETGADSSTNFTFELDWLFHAVAEHITTNNYIAKIYFRSKGPQWQSDVYRAHWHRFLSGEFADCFVPALEETGSRSADTSIAGRMGLWQSGAANQWGARAVPDNARFNNQRNHCNQRLLNHFLRNSVYNIACGAQYINNFDSADPYMSVLWDLIAKGALYVPRREELVSINPVFLGMVTDPDARFDARDRQEKFNTWWSEASEATNRIVIGRKGTEWAGAPVTEWDFSRYASGVKERRSEFLPAYPHGIVMIAPPQSGFFADTNAVRGSMAGHMHPMYRNIQQEIDTDGRYYISSDGTITNSADTYYTTVETAITQAAGQLPLTVTGRVAWVCAQTAPTHLRLTLVDGGYLNPDDRTATVRFHTVTPLTVTDLLDGSTFGVTNGQVLIDVPSGLFRFIDIELSEPFFPKNGWGEFASVHGLTGAADADADGDGLSDFAEYGLGGDPTNASDRGIPPALNFLPTGVGFQSPEVIHTNPGISYVREWSDNLLSNVWKNSWYTSSNWPSARPDYLQTEYRLNAPTNKNLFFRLRISQP